MEIADQRARTLYAADLFCGCGGLTLGAVEAARARGLKLHVSFAADLSRHAIEAYTRNFSTLSTSIRNDCVQKLFPGQLGHSPTVHEQHLAKQVGHLDVLLAGPPCQGHSDLNNSTRRSDPRNALYLRVIRAAELIRPQAVLVENVPGVVHDEGEVVNTAVETLRRLGYSTHAYVLDSMTLGLPQTRKRHLLAAVLKGRLPARLAAARSSGVPTLRQYIHDLTDEPGSKTGPFYEPGKPNAENKRRIDFLFDNGCFDLPNSERPRCHRDNDHSYAAMYGRLRWNKPAGTITSGFGCMGQGRYVHPSKRRTLTPHEAARIQGFPDFFDFSTVSSVTRLREMIANAVPPRLSAICLDQLFEAGVFD